MRVPWAFVVLDHRATRYPRAFSLAYGKRLDSPPFRRFSAHPHGEASPKRSDQYFAECSRGPLVPSRVLSAALSSLLVGPANSSLLVLVLSVSSPPTQGIHWASLLFSLSASCMHPENSFRQ